MRVIGGAGGKLNMLKLRGVKSPEDYRIQHAEKAAAKRNRLKQQQRREKELGIHGAKVQARKDLKDAKRKAEESFIGTVAEAMGWDLAPLQKEIEGLSPEAQKKAEATSHCDMLVRNQTQLTVFDTDPAQR